MKGQVSFEFLVSLSILITITTIFSVFAAQRFAEVQDAQDYVRLENLAHSVKSEIDTAHSVVDGYVRYFELPELVGRDNYSIKIENDFVVIDSAGVTISAGVQPVVGNVTKGANSIKKVGGSVHLNE